MESLRRRLANGVTAVAALEGKGGQPLVLLHGFPFDHSMWDPQIQALRGDAKILAPDLPGLGRSELPPGPSPSMHDYAGEVLAWMDEAGISRATVAGLSMGGYVAFAMWRRARERIAGLALLDTKAEADSEEAKRGRLDARRAIEEHGMAGVASGMLEKVLGKTTRRIRPDVVERVRKMIVATPPAGAIAAVDAMRERPDSVRDLAAIDVPTVVIVGEEDELTPPSVVRATAEGIRRDVHRPTWVGDASPRWRRRKGDFGAARAAIPGLNAAER
jgi:pimeloyl-ACP methyl ester carboxylesterase